MSAQKVSPAVRVARWSAAVILVILLAAVAFHVTGRRGGRDPVAPIPQQAVLEEGLVDRKEKVRHTEYLEGKPAADIQAARAFRDPDGRGHLEGGVEVTDYGPDGSVLSRMSADRIVYEESLTRFEISGRVRVALEDVVLEGEHFDYDREAGVFRTRKGGVFSSAGMEGSAAAISYDRVRDEAVLEGGFRIEIDPEEQGEERAVLTGDVLRFRRRIGWGGVSGGARFAHGPIEGTAESLSFGLKTDARFFDSMTFAGAVRIALAAPAENAFERRVIEADMVAVSFFPSGGRVETLEAGGDVRMSFVSHHGQETRLSAARARLKLSEQRELLSWAAAEGFRLESAGENGDAWTVEGGKASGDGDVRTFRAEGEAGRDAVIDSQRFRMAAASLEVTNGGRDIDATGGVKGLLKPRADGPASGLFSGDAPVFISAQRMTHSGEKGHTHFEGMVRVWQDGRRLTAGELDMDEDPDGLRGRGGVEAAFPRSPEGGKDERTIEAGGKEMTYSPADRALVFRGKASVRIPGARLAAEEVVAVVRTEGYGLETMTARTGVVVSRGLTKGQGREARYDPEAERLVLLGKPVLVDGEGRSTSGDKLTFDLADDKIRLENEGRGRSTTVAKS